MTARSGSGLSTENVVKATQQLMVSLQAHSCPLQQLFIASPITLLTATASEPNSLSWLQSQWSGLKLTSQAMVVIFERQFSLLLISCYWFA
jgi:hypothetical protein